MANLILIIVAKILILAATAAIAFAGKGGGDIARRINRKHLGLHKKEKLTHLRLYWHDILSGQNPSSIMIQRPVSKYSSSSFFGSVTMIDNALTSDVSINSTVVGQSQGIYAGAAQKELGFLMAMNFVFKTGKYNGSTITIFGRNQVMSKVREIDAGGWRQWSVPVC